MAWNHNIVITPMWFDGAMRRSDGSTFVAVGLVVIVLMMVGALIMID